MLLKLRLEEARLGSIRKYLWTRFYSKRRFLCSGYFEILLLNYLSYHNEKDPFKDF